MHRPLNASPSLRAVTDAHGRRRWLVELHPRDLIRYEAAVLPLVRPIESALGAGVVANRLVVRRGTKGEVIGRLVVVRSKFSFSTTSPPLRSWLP